MEPTSEIGPQFCRHNRFTLPNYTPDNAAWHKGLPADWIASRFDYNPTFAQETPVPVNPTALWFFPNTVDTACTNNAGNYHCGEAGHGYKDFLSETELELLEENQGLYDPPSEVYAWEARRNLLAKLLRYPSLKTLYPAAGVFFNQQISTSAGQFAQCILQMDRAMLIEPGQLEALQQKRNQITSLIQELDLLDATLTTPEEIDNADSIFFAARAGLLNQTSSLINEKDALVAVIEEVRATALDAVVETLATLPQTTAYEENQAFLNSLAIKTARAETFSEEEYALLRAIAVQCPDIAGATRDKAIDLLPVGDPFRTIRESGDEPDCQEQRNSQRERTESLSLEMLLWPNPADSELFAHFHSPFSGKIEVIALTGRTILWSADLQAENRTIIPVQQLSPGFYLLIATDTFGHRRIQKFAMSKS